MLVERVHNVFGLLADQQRRCGVGASAMRQCCSRARARSDLIASGALSVAPKPAAHYLAAALTMSTAAPQALGQSTNARYGEGQVYIGLPQLYTAMRLQQFQALDADASRQTARRTID